MKTAAMVFAAWIIGTAGAFWHFEGKQYVAVKPPKNVRTGAPQFEARLGEVTVVNVWSPRCPCSRFVEPHVIALVRNYGNSVRFVTLVQSSGSQEDAHKDFKERRIGGDVLHDPSGRIARSLRLWSTPSAAVFGRDGKLLYRGSYNVRRNCNDVETQFVRLALESAVEDRAPKVRETPFLGCSIRFED
jgi:thiol-disulfide isomerase/thioredoxin